MDPAGDHKLLIGLIGAGIQQSLTPAMQEEAFAWLDRWL